MFLRLINGGSVNTLKYNMMSHKFTHANVVSQWQGRWQCHCNEVTQHHRPVNDRIAHLVTLSRTGFLLTLLPQHTPHPSLSFLRRLTFSLHASFISPPKLIPPLLPLPPPSSLCLIIVSSLHNRERQAHRSQHPSEHSNTIGVKYKYRNKSIYFVIQCTCS